MANNWHPEPCLEYRGKIVFHAYKDEYSDIPLDNWYTLNAFELPGSDFEFDIRDIRKALRAQAQLPRETSDIDVLKLAIDAKLLPSLEVYQESDER